VCCEGLNFNLFEGRVVEYYIQRVYELMEKINSETPSSKDIQQSKGSSSSESDDREVKKPSNGTPPKQTRKTKFVEKEVQSKEPPKKPSPSRDQSPENKPPICCRKFFYKGEVLDESESLTLEFKNYRYPWDEIHLFNIIRTINGFLNRNGGIILIGVEEDNDTKRPTVRGNSIYNEKTREDINMQLTSLCKRI